VPSLSRAQYEPLFLRSLPLPGDAPPAGLSERRLAAWREELAEAGRVVARFCSHLMPPGSVTAVTRVQSLRLWGLYSHSRTEAEAGARAVGGPGQGDPGLAPGERYLFHGACKEAVVSILAFGFDCRVANMSGLLGAGAYFAERADYSVEYSKKPARANFAVAYRPEIMTAQRLMSNMSPGSFLMIMARVALGRSGPARAGERLAAPGFQSSSSSSGVGDIFAVFDNYQAYPEYVIRFNVAPPAGSPKKARKV